MWSEYGHRPLGDLAALNSARSAPQSIRPWRHVCVSRDGTSPIGENSAERRIPSRLAENCLTRMALRWSGVLGQFVSVDGSSAIYVGIGCCVPP